VAGSSSPASGG